MCFLIVYSCFLLISFNISYVLIFACPALSVLSASVKATYMDIILGRSILKDTENVIISTYSYMNSTFIPLMADTIKKNTEIPFSVYPLLDLYSLFICISPFLLWHFLFASFCRSASPFLFSSLSLSLLLKFLII